MQYKFNRTRLFSSQSKLKNKLELLFMVSTHVTIVYVAILASPSQALLDILACTREHMTFEPLCTQEGESLETRLRSLAHQHQLSRWPVLHITRYTPEQLHRPLSHQVSSGSAVAIYSPWVQRAYVQSRMQGRESLETIDLSSSLYCRMLLPP